MSASVWQHWSGPETVSYRFSSASASPGAAFLQRSAQRASSSPCPAAQQKRRRYVPTGTKVGSRLSSAPTALFASAACDAPAVGLRSAELQLGSLKVSTRRREAKIAHRGEAQKQPCAAAAAARCAPPYSYTRRRPSPRTRAAAVYFSTARPSTRGASSCRRVCFTASRRTRQS